MAASEILDWQRQMWDCAAPVYAAEVEPRFEAVRQRILEYASIHQGEHVLDIGCGAGTLTLALARAAGEQGSVAALDLSPEMVAIVGKRCNAAQLSNVSWNVGNSQALPFPDQSLDVVVASLSLMFSPDKTVAAAEIGRVLRHGGRLIAAVLAGPKESDLVHLQQILGRHQPAPPARGMGPGSMANLAQFTQELKRHEVYSHVECHAFEFPLASADEAWSIFAAGAAHRMTAEQHRAARAEIESVFWPHGARPRQFRQMVQYVLGKKGNDGQNVPSR